MLYEVITISGAGSRISITSDSKLWTVTSANKITNYTCDMSNLSSSARVRETEETLFDKVTFYPNPVNNGILNIKGLPLNKDAAISISNLQGQVIYNKNTTTSEIVSLYLNENSFPQGIYILKVEMVEDVITTKLKVN